VGLVTIGVDVGQVKDPTAVCLCELDKDRYVVRFLQRLPLGTNYSLVAARLAEIHSGAVARRMQERQIPDTGRLLTGRQLLGWTIPERFETASSGVYMFVDRTGVGLPVCDLLREKIGAKNLCGINITGGDKRECSPHSKGGSVGKAYLVSRLQALLQPPKRIVLPETDEARALGEELLNFEIRPTEDTNMIFGAFKAGTHDDLAIALGLAVLFDRAKLEPPKVTTFSRWR